MTAKRQVTFPKAICDSLDLKPGQMIDLQPGEKADEWRLKPVRLDRSKLGAGRKYVKRLPRKAPDLESIRETMTAKDYEELRR